MSGGFIRTRSRVIECFISLFIFEKNCQNFKIVFSCLISIKRVRFYVKCKTVDMTPAGSSILILEFLHVVLSRSMIKFKDFTKPNQTVTIVD